MLIGRSSEIDYLKKIFDQTSASLVTLYGAPGVGTTSVWRDFVKDKKFVYIKCPKSSGRQTNFLISLDLKLKGYEFTSDFPEFNEILNAILDKYKLEKFVLVLDDFENLFKIQPEYAEDIFSYLKINKADNRFMILLVSHDIRYVENAFVKQIGKNALSINGFYKIHPMSFMDLFMYYNSKDTRKCIELYALTGGNISYYDFFDINKSIKENIIKNFLVKGAPFANAGYSFILESLREVNVYGTILYCLANGYNKLNDIYQHTGYSRAKISVYFKNLMGLDIVEKVSSFDTAGVENTVKGVYRISNPIVLFWYKFIYPHQSYLEIMSAEKYYDTFIEHGMEDFINVSLPLVCKEYLTILNNKRALPIKVVKSGEWVGKAGTIHFIGKDEKRNMLVAFCYLGDDPMDLSEYEWFEYCLKEARVRADYIYLFSKNGFDEEFQKEKENTNIRMIDINNL